MEKWLPFTSRPTRPLVPESASGVGGGSQSPGRLGSERDIRDDSTPSRSMVSCFVLAHGPSVGAGIARMLQIKLSPTHDATWVILGASCALSAVRTSG